VLLLDEPTTGVDPVTRQDFWQLVIKLVSQENGENQNGVSVLLTTPYMDEAARCHRVGFMREGVMIAEGTPSELRDTLSGRILELRGQPIALLRNVAHQDDDVEDVQAFGDRLHVRVRENKAEVVLGRLKSTIRGEGGNVTDLRSVPPVLEDIFIALSEQRE
jgi:ABC-2 type transport system ATP-binding protein